MHTHTKQTYTQTHNTHTVHAHKHINHTNILDSEIHVMVKLQLKYNDADLLRSPNTFLGERVLPVDLFKELSAQNPA